MRRIDLPLSFAVVAVAIVVATAVLTHNPSGGSEAAATANQAGVEDYHWWQYSGAWIAAFTIVLTFSTAGMWWVNERSLDHAKQSSERQLRAYVHVASAKVKNLDKASGREIVVVVKNYGQTPALKARFRSAEHVREWPLQGALDDLSKVEIRTGVEALPFGRPVIMHIPVGDLTEWSERALRNGEHAIYFWGLVTYEDVFGKPHFTRIRLVCEGEGVASGSMHATEEGNERD